MAVFKVRAPDGSILRIEGPDDATDDEIAAFAESQFAAAPTPAPAEQSAFDQTIEAAGAPTAPAPVATDAAGKFGGSAADEKAALDYAKRQAEQYLKRNPKDTAGAQQVYKARATEQLQDAQLKRQLATKNDSIALSDVAPLFGRGVGSIVRGAGEIFGSSTLTDVGKNTEEFYDPMLSEAAQNPLNALAGTQRSIVESLPGTVVGGGVGGVLGRVGGAALAGTQFGRAAELATAIAGRQAPLAARAALAAPGRTGVALGEGVVSAAAGGASAADSFDNLKDTEVKASPRYQELVDSGLNDKEARAALRAEFIRKSAVQQGLTTAAIGAALPGVESRIAESIAGRGLKAEGSIALQALQTGAKETGQEFLQSGAEQVASNQATQALINPEQSLTEDVLVSASKGASAGAITGAAFGGAAALSDKIASGLQPLQDLTPLVSGAPAPAPAPVAETPAAATPAPAAATSAPAPAATVQPLADLTPLITPNKPVVATTSDADLLAAVGDVDASRTAEVRSVVTGTGGSGRLDTAASLEPGVGAPGVSFPAVPGRATPAAATDRVVLPELKAPPEPGSIPAPKPIPPSPEQVADSVQVFARAGLNLKPVETPMSPAFMVARQMASIFNRPLITADLSNTDAGSLAPAPNGAILPNGAVVLNAKTTDAPIAVVTHEVSHGLDDDVKAALLNTAVPTLQNKEEFQVTFLYGLDNDAVAEIQAPVGGQRPSIAVQVQRLIARNQRLAAEATTPEQQAQLAASRQKIDELVNEEMVMIITQKEAETPAFWNELRGKLGDNAFGKLVDRIVLTLDKLIAGFRKGSPASKWTNNLPAVRSAITTALAEQGKRNEATTPTPAPEVQQPSRVRGSAGGVARESRPDQGNAGREEDGSLKGLPRAFTVAGRPITASVWQPAVEVARTYAQTSGIAYNPPLEYARVDKTRATRIAAEYDRMQHDPQNPEVKAAYDAMIAETVAQYQAILDSGLTVEFIDYAKQGDPYAASPRLMTEDVRNNNHMWVFSTRDGFGSSELDVSDNPLLAETGFEISGKPALANDLFRVVHDYFGHVKEGVGFRADGEENAWRAHSAMYSPLARRAMTSETRGQNSWVNFGPNGEANRTATGATTIYADQKVGLLPEWVSEDTDAPTESVNRPSRAVPPAAEPVVGVHYGKAGSLRTLSATSYGTGIKGAEKARLDESTDARIKKRVYFYLKTGDAIPAPEAGLGPNVYQTTLQNIADPDNQVHLDAIRAVKQGSDANAFESAVLDAGFDGYLNRQQGTVVVLNRDVDVESLGNQRDLTLTQRAPSAAPPAPTSRTEGNERVRRPQGREVMDVIQAQRQVPGLRMEFGEARVPLAEVQAANAALEELGSTMRFSQPAQVSDSIADQYAAVVAQYQNTEQWLKAPDGTATKLTERQWVQVRTPAFKQWFGDWEAAYAQPGGVWGVGVDVSKAVGANGEPLVLYHGTDTAGFMEFNRPGGARRGELGIFATDNYQMARSYVSKGRLQPVAPLPIRTQAELEAEGFEFAVLDDGRVEMIDAGGYDVNGPADLGYRFASIEDAVAEANRLPSTERVGGVYSLFANIRNPQEAFFEGAVWTGERVEQYQVLVDDEPQALPDGRTYMRFDEAETLAAELGGTVETAPDNDQSTDDVAREAGRIGADGALIHDVVDEGPGPSNYFFEPSNVFILFEPNQLKSADFNTGEFGASGDLRFSRPESFLTPPERAKLRRDTAARFVDAFKELPSGNEFAAVAFAGKAKRGWYKNSALALEHVFGPDAPRFAALLAATSPQTSVQDNLINALNIWKNWIAAGRPQSRADIVAIMGRSVMGSRGADSVLDAWINNSVRSLTAEDPGQIVLSGPKVNSFMLNLRGFVDEVTNDAWMANFALVDQKMFSGKMNAAGTDPGKGPGYLAMSARVREAAKTLTKLTGEAWSPAEVQETVWSWAKTLYELQTADVGAQELVYDGALTDALIASTPDFRTLFHEDRNESVLRAAGYGPQLATLRDRTDLSFAGGQEPRAGGQAAPFDPDAQQRYELRAAARLEQLRAGRLAEKGKKPAAVAAEPDDGYEIPFSRPESPEFKRWFGDSKVVDAKGRPLVVYHGTMGDFNTFKESSNGAHGRGIYFAVDPRISNYWAGATEEDDGTPNTFGGSVLPVYLSLQNPATQDDYDRLGGDREALEAEGFDGIMVDSEIVAFRPEQIKSAIGNVGTFDPTNPDIRFARPSQQYGNQLLGGMRFVLPTEGNVMATRRRLQDYFLRMDVVQKAIIGQGGVVGEAQDVYRAEERSYGRMEEQLKDFARLSLEPLLRDAAAAKIDLEELALYAYAKHAPEANAYIASIDPNLPDGGSGMTDAEAAAIEAKAASEGKTAALDNLHAQLMTIADNTRRVLLDEGLISQAEYDTWVNAYDNYVPLKGFAVGGPDGTPGLTTGRGFDIKGKESLRRLGRTTRAGDIIENMIKDFERAVVRGERNQVAKVFLDLALKNPDASLWVVAPKTTTRGIDPVSGQVRTTIVDDKGPDTVSVKVGGQEIRIKVKDELLLRAMKRAAQDETGETTRFLMKSVGWYSTWMRNTLTRYNPVFGAINAVRDVQFGLAATLDELGAEGAKLFAKYYAQGTVTSGRYEMGKLDQNARAADRAFEEYRAAGATTGGFYQRDVEDISQDLRRMLVAAGAPPRNAMERIVASRPADAARAALRTLEIIGSISENAARFAAYRAARDMGRTPAEAASIAKNLTTNFNRKGEWGQAVNALYLFFNAAVQGSARTLKMLTNRKMRYVFAGVTAMAAGLAAMNADVGGDDEDGQANWDKIPDYEKERNLIIMLPPGMNLPGAAAVGFSGRYIKIPMAYGLNIFPVFGYQLADTFRNQLDSTRGVTLGKAGVNMASAVFGSFNPFGGAVDPSNTAQVALAVAPTLIDLPIQLVMGVNAFGSPTGTSKFPGDQRPDSEVFSPRQAGGPALYMARKINAMTGGDQARPGFIDVSAGDIENLVRNIGGGTGQFLFDVAVNMPTKLLAEQPMTNRDIPLVKQFYGRIDPTINLGLAYDRRNEVLKEVNQRKAAEKLGITQETTTEQKRLLALAGPAESFTKAMSQLRKEEIKFADNPANSAGAIRAKRKELELQRARIAQQFNANFVKIQKDLKE